MALSSERSEGRDNGAARRLCRLLEVNAPQMIVDNEKKCLIEALVLHRHGVSKVILGPIPEEKAADSTV